MAATGGGAIHRTMDGQDWLLLVGLSVLWGGSFFFAGVALRELPPLTIAFARVALAALTLLVVLRVMGLRLPREPGMWRDFLIMGALNNAIPFSLIFWGQSQTSSGLASVLNATTPFFTLLLAHLLTADEKMRANGLAGILIGICGVAVMIGPAALEGLGGSALGQLAVLGGALSYACAGIFGRRFSGRPLVVVAAGQVIGSSLLMAPIAGLAERPWLLPLPGAATLLALVALAVVSTAFAYVIYFRLLARAGATNLLLVTLLIPVSANLLGVLVLGERIGLTQAAGMALIAAGLLCIDGRLLRWRRAVPSGS
ncbi:MAG TPA: DMT family transporter [Alphaproteobacteria bacterium]|nr:DMT family transporter [Alphaproteobacteria bacterium]